MFKDSEGGGGVELGIYMYLCADDTAQSLVHVVQCTCIYESCVVFFMFFYHIHLMKDTLYVSNAINFC